MKVNFDAESLKSFVVNHLKSHAISSLRVVLLMVFIGAVAMTLTSLVNAYLLMDLSPEGDLTQSVTNMCLAVVCSLFVMPYKIFKTKLKEKASQTRPKLNDIKYVNNGGLQVDSVAAAVYYLVFLAVAIFFMFTSAHLVREESILAFLFILPVSAELALVSNKSKDSK
ncbi:hypothetical protein [Vibrio crassostreae]|uniref:hypothetical protein n=1 Tax=Vibrio crassostreae TaxID=246167 RepID=UPI001B30A36E|nr:hypothetical protein [Vibrio crassostreae]